MATNFYGCPSGLNKSLLHPKKQTDSSAIKHPSTEPKINNSLTDKLNNCAEYQIVDFSVPFKFTFSDLTATPAIANSTIEDYNSYLKFLSNVCKCSEIKVIELFISANLKNIIETTALISQADTISELEAIANAVTDRILALKPGVSYYFPCGYHLATDYYPAFIRFEASDKGDLHLEIIGEDLGPKQFDLDKNKITSNLSLIISDIKHSELYLINTGGKCYSGLIWQLLLLSKGNLNDQSFKILALNSSNPLLNVLFNILSRYPITKSANSSNHAISNKFTGSMPAKMLLLNIIEKTPQKPQNLHTFDIYTLINSIAQYYAIQGFYLHLEKQGKEQQIQFGDKYWAALNSGIENLCRKVTKLDFPSSDMKTYGIAVDELIYTLGKIATQLQLKLRLADRVQKPPQALPLSTRDMLISDPKIEIKLKEDLARLINELTNTKHHLQPEDTFTIDDCQLSLAVALKFGGEKNIQEYLKFITTQAMLLKNFMLQSLRAPILTLNHLAAMFKEALPTTQEQLTLWDELSTQELTHFLNCFISMAADYLILAFKSTNKPLVSLAVCNSLKIITYNINCLFSKYCKLQAHGLDEFNILHLAALDPYRISEFNIDSKNKPTVTQFVVGNTDKTLLEIKANPDLIAKFSTNPVYNLKEYFENRKHAPTIYAPEITSGKARKKPKSGDLTTHIALYSYFSTDEGKFFSALQMAYPQLIQAMLEHRTLLPPSKYSFSQTEFLAYTFAILAPKVPKSQLLNSIDKPHLGKVTNSVYKAQAAEWMEDILAHSDYLPGGESILKSQKPKLYNLLTRIKLIAIGSLLFSLWRKRFPGQSEFCLVKYFDMIEADLKNSTDRVIDGYKMSIALGLYPNVGEFGIDFSYLEEKKQDLKALESSHIGKEIIFQSKSLPLRFATKKASSILEHENTLLSQLAPAGVALSWSAKKFYLSCVSTKLYPESFKYYLVKLLSDDYEAFFSFDNRVLFSDFLSLAFSTDSDYELKNLFTQEIKQNPNFISSWESLITETVRNLTFKVGQNHHELLLTLFFIRIAHKINLAIRTHTPTKQDLINDFLPDLQRLLPQHKEHKALIQTHIIGCSLGINLTSITDNQLADLISLWFSINSPEVKAEANFAEDKAYIEEIINFGRNLAKHSLFMDESSLKNSILNNILIDVYQVNDVTNQKWEVWSNLYGNLSFTARCNDLTKDKYIIDLALAVVYRNGLPILKAISMDKYTQAEFFLRLIQSKENISRIKVLINSTKMVVFEIISSRYNLKVCCSAGDLGQESFVVKKLDAGKVSSLTYIPKDKAMAHNLPQYLIHGYVLWFDKANNVIIADDPVSLIPKYRLTKDGISAVDDPEVTLILLDKNNPLINDTIGNFESTEWIELTAANKQNQFQPLGLELLRYVVLDNSNSSKLSKIKFKFDPLKQRWIYDDNKEFYLVSYSQMANSNHPIIRQLVNNSQQKLCLFLQQATKPENYKLLAAYSLLYKFSDQLIDVGLTPCNFESKGKTSETSNENWYSLNFCEIDLTLNSIYKPQRSIEAQIYLLILLIYAEQYFPAQQLIKQLDIQPQGTSTLTEKLLSSLISGSLTILQDNQSPNKLALVLQLVIYKILSYHYDVSDKPLTQKQAHMPPQMLTNITNLYHKYRQSYNNIAVSLRLTTLEEEYLRTNLLQTAPLKLTEIELRNTELANQSADKPSIYTVKKSLPGSINHWQNSILELINASATTDSATHLKEDTGYAIPFPYPRLRFFQDFNTIREEHRRKGRTIEHALLFALHSYMRNYEAKEFSLPSCLVLILLIAAAKPELFEFANEPNAPLQLCMQIVCDDILVNYAEYISQLKLAFFQVHTSTQINEVGLLFPLKLDKEPYSRYVSLTCKSPVSSALNLKVLNDLHGKLAEVEKALEKAYTENINEETTSYTIDNKDVNLFSLDKLSNYDQQLGSVLEKTMQELNQLIREGSQAKFPAKISLASDRAIADLITRLTNLGSELDSLTKKLHFLLANTVKQDFSILTSPEDKAIEQAYRIGIIPGLSLNELLHILTYFKASNYQQVYQELESKYKITLSENELIQLQQVAVLYMQAANLKDRLLKAQQNFQLLSSEPNSRHHQDTLIEASKLISARRAYDIKIPENFILTYIEYVSDGMLLRQSQIKTMLAILNSENSEGCLYELGMGEGKTTVMLTAFIEELARSGQLPVVMLTEAQFPVVVSTLQKLMQEKYQKGIMVFHYTADQLNDLEILNDIKFQLKNAQKKKLAIVMPSSTLEMLEALLLYNIAVNSDTIAEVGSSNKSNSKLTDQHENPWQPRISLITEILLFFREQVTALFDESHKNLNVFSGVNIAYGENVAPDPETIGIIKLIYLLMVKNPEIENILHLSQDNQAKIDKMEYLFKIIPVLAGYIFEDKRGDWGLDAEDKADFISYMEYPVAQKNKKPNQQFSAKLNALKLNNQEKAAQAIVFVKYILHKILPNTLSRSGQENYGKAANQENSASPANMLAKVVPYRGAGEVETTQFFNVYEIMAYSFQLSLAYGFKEHGEARSIINLSLNAAKNASIEYNCPLAETTEAIVFKEMTNYSLEQLFEDNNLADFIQKLDYKGKLYLQYSALCHSLSTTNKIISTGPIAVVDSVKRAIAFSGTLGPTSMYNPKLFGSDGKNLLIQRTHYGQIIIKLLADIENGITQITYLNSKDGLEAAIRKSLSDSIQSGVDEGHELQLIIDGCAAFKKQSTKEIARTLLKELGEVNDRDRPQGVWFFDPDSGQAKLATSQNEELSLVNAESSGIVMAGYDKYSLFYYLDQVRGLGTNLTFLHNALANLNIGPKTQFDDLIQLILRLRNFLDNQSVNIIFDAGSDGTKAIDIYSILNNSVYNQVVEKVAIVYRAYIENIKGIFRNAAMEELLKQAKLQNYYMLSATWKKVEELFNLAQLTLADIFAKFATIETFQKTTSYLKELIQQLSSRYSFLVSAEVSQSCSNLIRQMENDPNLLAEVLVSAANNALAEVAPGVQMQQLAQQNHENQSQQQNQNQNQNQNQQQQALQQTKNELFDQSRQYTFAENDLTTIVKNETTWNSSKNGESVQLITATKLITVAMLFEMGYQRSPTAKKITAYPEPFEQLFDESLLISINFYQIYQNVQTAVFDNSLALREVSYCLLKVSTQNKTAELIIISQQEAETFKLLLASTDKLKWTDGSQVDLWLIDLNGNPIITNPKSQPLPNAQTNLSLHLKIMHGLWQANLFAGNWHWILKNLSHLIRAKDINLALNYLELKTFVANGKNKVINTSIIANILGEGFSSPNLNDHRIISYYKANPQECWPSLIGNLSAETIANLDPSTQPFTLMLLLPQQIKHLKTKEQVMLLRKPEQITRLPLELLDYIDLNCVKKLSPDAIKYLQNKRLIARLELTQINHIVVEQLQYLSATQFYGLSNKMLGQLTQEFAHNIPYLLPHQIKFLAKDLVSYIPVTRVNEMVGADNLEQKVAELTPKQLAAITKPQLLVYITQAQIDLTKLSTLNLNKCSQLAAFGFQDNASADLVKQFIAKISNSILSAIITNLSPSLVPYFANREQIKFPSAFHEKAKTIELQYHNLLAQLDVEYGEYLQFKLLAEADINDELANDDLYS